MTQDINAMTRNIEIRFEQIEKNILSGDLFSEWRGQFEVKKVYIKKENADIKCDLDIRLAHWPEGVSVKVYKHKALAVLPYVKDEQVVRTWLNIEPASCKFWKDAFYFSHMEDLDEGRYVLREGNQMADEDSAECVRKLKMHIEEINGILIEKA